LELDLDEWMSNQWWHTVSFVSWWYSMKMNWKMTTTQQAMMMNEWLNEWMNEWGIGTTMVCFVRSIDRCMNEVCLTVNMQFRWSERVRENRYIGWILQFAIPPSSFYIFLYIWSCHTINIQFEFKFEREEGASLVEKYPTVWPSSSSLSLLSSLFTEIVLLVKLVESLHSTCTAAPGVLLFWKKEMSNSWFTCHGHGWIWYLDDVASI